MDPQLLTSGAPPSRERDLDNLLQFSNLSYYWRAQVYGPVHDGTRKVDPGQQPQQPTFH